MIKEVFLFLFLHAERDPEPGNLFMDNPFTKKSCQKYIDTYLIK